MRSKKKNIIICIVTMITILSLSVPVWCMAAEDGQNPVMNFIGNYVCDRARIEIMPKGEDMADITVSWGSSAFEHTEWSMSGVFDTETLSVTYSDCTKKEIVYDRESEEAEQTPQETIEYTGGTGAIHFGNDGTLAWNDDQEQVAAGLVFEYSVMTEPEETFGANMAKNVKYIMYVGTNDKDTYEPVLPFDEARELANNICAKYISSGFTEIDATGGWMDENRVLATEASLIYVFFDATEEELQQVMDELIEQLHQSSILVEKQEAEYAFYSGK